MRVKVNEIRIFGFRNNWQFSGANGEGKCEINLTTRKKCKKCRLQACFRAGMRAESVLDEDQFKKRFRRMIRKQKKKERQVCQVGVGEECSKVSSPGSNSMDISDEFEDDDEDDDEQRDDSLDIFLESVKQVEWNPDQMETEQLFDQVINGNSQIY